MKPLLTTFVSTESDVVVALDSGVTALILEDSKLSLRSFSDDFSVPHFEKILRLEQRARELSPSVILSVNCDIMIHDRHFSLLELFVKVLERSSVRRIRVQDFGLISWFRERVSGVEIHLSSEMGNNNGQSSYFFSKKGVAQQTFTNEMTQKAIENIVKQKDSFWEILVHGSILLQYSPRRLISSRKQEEALWKKWAYDERGGKHPFLFYDNPHGHLMFFWADRCLLGFVSELKKIPLNSWLVDLRGASLSYWKETLRTYASCIKKNTLSSQDLSEFSDRKGFLEKLSEKPFRSVFFRANRTDFIKKKRKIKDFNLLGRVVEVLKKTHIAVELKNPLRVGQSVFYQTPSRKQYALKVETIKNIDHEFIDRAPSGTLVFLAWRSHIVPQSFLFEDKLQ